MQIRHFAECTLVFVFAFLPVPIPTDSQEAATSHPASVAGASKYPDTKAGLQQLLDDAREAAKTGDSQKLTALLKDTEIPNCDAWLHTMYESDKADSWMSLCDAATRREKEKSLMERFTVLAKADGEFLTRKVNDDPEPGRGMEWGWLQAIRHPLDIYFASWKSAESATIEPVGYFMFIDGGFRWESGIAIVNIKPEVKQAQPGTPGDSSTATASQTGTFDALNGNDPQPPPPPHNRIRIGGNVQARNLVHQVFPIYPQDAKYEHITGTVVLHVIVARDGSVQTVEVVSGPDALVRSAVDAVKQWRYKPILLNGQPVEVDTTVQVIFSIR